MSAPLSAVIAARPSSALLMVTNPNPRERPVTRSIITIASVTVPWAPKTSRRSASVAEKGRFPIYNFILLVFVGSCYADGCFLECTNRSPEGIGAALPTCGEPALPESLSSNFDLTYGGAGAVWQQNSLMCRFRHKRRLPGKSAFRLKNIEVR